MRQLNLRKGTKREAKREAVLKAEADVLSAKEESDAARFAVARNITKVG